MRKEQEGLGGVVRGHKIRKLVPDASKACY